MASVEPIGREDLQQQLERGDELVLVDALAPMSYARSHLPGAINLPADWVEERAPMRIPDLETEIVVYCSDVDCDASGIVARRLLELGYRNVRHYPGGKSDWVEGGLPLEGSAGAL